MAKSDDLFVKQALTAEEYAEFKAIRGRLAQSSRSIPAMVAANVPLEAWWAELATGVSHALENAREAASKDRREKGAAELPWVHRASPEVMLQDVQRLQWLNNRILTFAREMLSKHVILADGLEWQAQALREQVEIKDRKLGVVLTGFVRRLRDANLLAASVKDLSKDAITALVDALNGEHEVDIFQTLNVSSGRKAMTDAERVKEEAEQAQLDEEIAHLQAERALAAASHQLDDAPIMPPEKLSDIETWNYETGPLPPEWWSYAQETPPTYRWEYKRADDEQLQLAFECDLPEAHSWDEMRRRDPLFDDISFGDIKGCKGGMNIVGDFISAGRGVEFKDIDDNVKKVWLFILLVSSIDRQKFDNIFAPAFFDGIVMPCHKSSPGIVRVLRWIGS